MSTPVPDLDSLPPLSPPVRVLFVCLGNICRSPLAEGVFLHLLEGDPRIQVDSAGTGSWHVGEPADPRARAVAAERGVHLPSRARQVDPADLDEFHVVVAMDASNRRDLLSLNGRGAAEVYLLRDFDPESRDGDRDVPDPYYGGDQGFVRVYEMVHRASRNLLEFLRARMDGAGTDGAGTGGMESPSP